MSPTLLLVPNAEPARADFGKVRVGMTSVPVGIELQNTQPEAQEVSIEKLPCEEVLCCILQLRSFVIRVLNLLACLPIKHWLYLQ